MKKCENCKHYAYDAEKPSISRCRTRDAFLGEGIYMMAREQRLPNNFCGPEGKAYFPRQM